MDKRAKKRDKKIKKILNNISINRTRFGTQELIYRFFDLKDTKDYTHSYVMKLLYNDNSSIIDISIDFHIETNIETEIIVRHFNIENILDLPQFICGYIRRNPNIRILSRENNNYITFINYIILIINKIINLLHIIDNNISDNNILGNPSSTYNKYINECIRLYITINSLNYNKIDLDYYGVTKIGYMILILEDYINYMNPSLH